MRIDIELRDTFRRAEELVPDAEKLLSGIDARARRRRSRRRLLRASAVAALVSLVAIGVPSWGPRLLDGALGHQPAGQAAPDAPDPAGALNFVIAGIDRAPGQSTPARSDAVVIVHVPTDRSAVYLVSVARDLLVDVPGYGPGRINSAFGLGRAPLLNQTLTGLTGLHFDGAVVVDLAGLVTVVDTLGGIEMCVDQTTRSYHTGTVYQPACRRFTGAEAKDYLRQRVGLPHGAADRERHVTQFLTALLSQISSTGTFTDIGKLRTLAVAVRSSITIDIGGHDVVDLAWQLREAYGHAVAVAVPTQGEGAETLALAGSAPSLFAALRTDTMAAWVAAHPAGP